MDTREKAKAFLYNMSECKPKEFFQVIDTMQKGIAFILFYLLDAEDEVIAGDIATVMNVSTARTAALLKKMERQKLITRSHSARDARKTVVKITDEGKKLSNDMQENILSKAEHIVKKISKKDLDEFIRITRLIKNALDE